MAAGILPLMPTNLTCREEPSGGLMRFEGRDLHELDVYHPRMRLAAPLLLTVSRTAELERLLDAVRPRESEE